MGTLNEDLTSIKTVEDTLTSNKVANFAYTDTAYANNNANGVVEYDVSQDQNIPVSTPSVLKVNETILAKGWRAKASSITRMLMNHFLGRLSYNLNKVNDNMSSLLSTLQSHLGTANGLATLDSTGRVPYNQLPESAMTYEGQWDASTNTPTLADGTGTKGSFYIVSVAGTQDLGSGNIQFFENDRVIYDGSVWSRLSAGDVKTVNNISPVDGNITLTKSDVGLSNVVNTGDSAIPASGGTDKFTTGGAYTELNKKQNKITNTIQTSQPSDSNYVGGFTNTSTSTNPTAHSSWTFTNIWNWVKTKLGVRSGTTDTAIGSSTKPVYLNSNGKAVALDNNSALVNLASTSSANMYASAPRPGVTGILPVANGGTGANSLSADTFKKAIIDITYPVGSMFITSCNITPPTATGVTWTRIDTNGYLWVTASTYENYRDYRYDVYVEKANSTHGVIAVWVRVSFTANGSTIAFLKTETLSTTNYMFYVYDSSPDSLANIAKEFVMVNIFQETQSYPQNPGVQPSGLNTYQIPSHTHSYKTSTASGSQPGSGSSQPTIPIANFNQSKTTDSTGKGGAHSHSLVTYAVKAWIRTA